MNLSTNKYFSRNHYHPQRQSVWNRDPVIPRIQCDWGSDLNESILLDLSVMQPILIPMFYHSINLKDCFEWKVPSFYSNILLIHYFKGLIWEKSTQLLFQYYINLIAISEDWFEWKATNFYSNILLIHYFNELIWVRLRLSGIAFFDPASTAMHCLNIPLFQEFNIP